MKTIRNATIAVLALLAAIFLLQNREAVETRFLVFRLQTPQSVLLLVILLLGFGLGLLAALGARLAGRKTGAEVHPPPEKRA